MAIDEAARHRLHAKLEQVIGAEEAAILMSQLPSAGWPDLATEKDVSQLGYALRTEMNALGYALRTEMNALGDSLRGEMNALEGRLRGEMNALGNQLRTEMERLATRLIMWTSSMIVAAVGLAFAAGRIA